MSSNVRIGLTLILAIVAVYLVTAWARGTGFWAGNVKTYHVHFQNVSGLKTSDPVLVRGVEVGQVETIEGKLDFVEVAIRIDAKQPIYSDAQAEIQVKELLGGKQVVLQIGTSGIAFQNEKPIPGKATYDLTSAFSHFGPILESIDTRQLRRVLANLDTLAIQMTMLSKQIHPSQVRQSVVGLNHILTETDKAITTLNALHAISTTDSVIRQAGRAISSADSTLGVIAHVAGHADILMIQTNGKIVATLQDMRSLMSELKKAQSPAGKMLYDSTFSRQITYTIDNLNRTLELIRADQLRVGISLGKAKSRKL